jgi:hypothetical protein
MAWLRSRSHASQLRHIAIHKASTRSKDNLPVTLRLLGVGVKFPRHLADFASAGMRGPTRLSPMAPSRPHGEGRALHSCVGARNRPTPSRLLTSLVCLPPSYTVVIPALPCAIWTCSLIYYLYTRFAAALVFRDNPHCYHYLYITPIRFRSLPLAHSEPTC